MISLIQTPLNQIDLCCCECGLSGYCFFREKIAPRYYCYLCVAGGEGEPPKIALEKAGEDPNALCIVCKSTERLAFCYCQNIGLERYIYACDYCSITSYAPKETNDPSSSFAVFPEKNLDLIPLEAGAMPPEAACNFCGFKEYVEFKDVYYGYYVCSICANPKFPQNIKSTDHPSDCTALKVKENHNLADCVNFVCANCLSDDHMVEYNAGRCEIANVFIAFCKGHNYACCVSCYQSYLSEGRLKPFSNPLIQ